MIDDMLGTDRPGIDGPNTAGVVAQLQALHRYAVLDTPPEPAFDRIVQLVARQLHCPIAAIGFIDADRQWIKARIGTDLTDVPRAFAPSSLVTRQDGIILVEDALADPRLAGERWVGERPHLRFYAGAPLTTPDGFEIGTLCVMDAEPRHDFDADARVTLTELAALVMTQLELRRQQQKNAQSALDLALINHILAVLTAKRTLREAIEKTTAQLVLATGAAFSDLLELREEDNIVVHLAMHAGPGHDAARYRSVSAGMPLPRGEVALNDLFDHDGATRTRLLTADPSSEFAIPARLVAAGITCSVAFSIHVGRHRYMLVLGFHQTLPDPHAIARLLERLHPVIRPVLECKLAEQGLTLLDTALAATHDAVMITEAAPINLPGPRVIFVNDGFTRMSGWSRQDIIGRSPRVLQAPETDRAQLRIVREALEHSRPVRVELLNQTRNRTRYWSELSITPVCDAAGEVTNWVAVMRDVTERRTREREALASAVLLRELTEQLLATHRIARMGAWRWTAETGMLELSPEACRMFGLQLTRPEISVEEALALVHPEDREQTRKALEEARPPTALELDFRTLDSDGMVRHCRWEGRYELSAAGESVAMQGYAQDVTERKQAEAVLLQTEKLNALGQLTGGLAHDFNNLLTVISLNLEIATDVLEAEHPVMEMLRPAMKAAASGARLTSSLLSFARRQPLNPRPSNVNALVRDIAELATRTLGERYPLDLDLQADLPTCLLDRALFESAVLNLLVNSRDAMREGGPIIIRTRSVEMPGAAVVGLDPGTYVRISVIDRGTGIPAHLQKQVFEPFFSTKNVGKGTGLGLSMVMGFTRQSGGQIELASEPGEGTAVHLYLPVA